MDFFSRLADRTQGRTPRVQPLTGSRFAETPTAFVLADAPGDWQGPAQERAIESTDAPTLRSPDRSASTREPVSQDVEAETHAATWRRSANAIASVQTHETSGFEVSTQEVQAPTTDRLPEPAKASMPLSFDGMNFPGESVWPSLESDLRARGHTTKADGRASYSADVPAGPGELNAESSISRMTGDLHGVRFQPQTVPSHLSLANLDEGTNQTTADLRSMPADPIEHSNQSAGLHQHSQLAETQLQPTSVVNNVFVRPTVERFARRREAARLQPEASFDYGDSTRSSGDSAPPVIRISIGRVEVRAVLPPTKPVERATPARTMPNLSLDEYLKRSEKGPK